MWLKLNVIIRVNKLKGKNNQTFIIFLEQSLLEAKYHQKIITPNNIGATLSHTFLHFKKKGMWFWREQKKSCCLPPIDNPSSQTNPSFVSINSLLLHMPFIFKIWNAPKCETSELWHNVTRGCHTWPQVTGQDAVH